MPHISFALSDIIKRRAFRAREHLECCSPDALGARIQGIAQSSYEIARGLELPSVRREYFEPAHLYARAALEDALSNLTTVIDCDLTQIELRRDPDEVVVAVQALMTAVHTIPLPSVPPARTG